MHCPTENSAIDVASTMATSESYMVTMTQDGKVRKTATESESETCGQAVGDVHRMNHQ